MKIITGKFKNRCIILKNDLTFNPIITRIRIDIFNILNYYCYWPEIKVLDLFAGSGIFGFESLSRGALSLHINDHDLATYQSLILNTQWLSITKKTTITNQDYQTCLNQLINQQVQFQLIFLDPPFKDGLLVNDILTQIWNQKLITKQGVIICRITKSMTLSLNVPLVIIKKKQYLNQQVLFLKMSSLY